MDATIMKKFKLALLASCIAIPAMAQEVPAAITDGATATATANSQAAVAKAQAQAKANASASAQANMSNNGQGTAQANASTVPRTMPPAIQVISPDKPLTRKEAVGVQVAQTWIQKFQKPHLDADGIVHFMAEKGQIFVVTSVDHITDIALAPGETIFPPLHVGDSQSWKFHPAMSRSAGKSVSHILVKPIDAGLSTNMVIQTNKRTISIALTSRQRDYMPLVSLDLPEDDDADFTNYEATKLSSGGVAATAAQPASACDQVPVVPPNQFEIDGDKAPWRPTQVYQVSTPVGIKTCIDFPSDIGSTSLPALLALADDGGWFSGPTKIVVNVRFVNRRFIVDEALSRLVLVDGVGSAQRSIKITRRGL